MKIFSWIKNIDRKTIIRNSFLIPILSVVVISISHVISWYGLGNPFSWAIYLSIAIEIFALASVSAATIKMKKGSIWLLFILVTLIQIIGNVFFTYQFINVESVPFKSWVELVSPWFVDWSIIDHKRLLALVQGGTLPFMSLIALHFFIKFNENLDSDNKIEKEVVPPVIPINSTDPVNPIIEETSEENPSEEIFQEESKTEEVENKIDSEEKSMTHIEMLQNIDNEKKTDFDQIHITDKQDRNRRRLHPASY